MKIKTEGGPCILPRIEDLVLCMNKVLEIWEINPDGTLHVVSVDTDIEYREIRAENCTLLYREQRPGDPAWPIHSTWEARAA